MEQIILNDHLEFETEFLKQDDLKLVFDCSIKLSLWGFQYSYSISYSLSNTNHRKLLVEESLILINKNQITYSLVYFVCFHDQNMINGRKQLRRTDAFGKPTD